MDNKDRFSGYKVAVACFVIMFMHMGALGSLGVFLPHIAAENGFDTGKLSLMVTFATAAAAIAGIVLVAPLMKKMTPKWLLFAVTFFIAGHFLGFSVGHTLWSYYIMATVGGSCIALGTTGVISNIIGEWFIDKRAAVIGVVVGGASFGTAVWQALAGILIDRIGYRLTYQVMAVVLLTVSVLANLLFVRMPKQLGQNPLGWDGNDTSKGHSNVAESGVTCAQALKSPAFYLIFSGVLVGGVAWTGFKTYMATMLTAYNYSTIAASNYSAFMNAIAAVTIIAGGFLAQRMGNKVYMMFLYLACFSGCLIVYLSGNAITSVVLCIAIILGACSSCSVSSLPPTICTESFGNKEYGRIIVYILSAGYTGQALTAVITHGLLDSGWRWQTIYMCYGTCAIIALALCLWGRAVAPCRKRNRTNEIITERN